MAECLHLGISLAEALDDLHSHRLSHRDIKPANIIFVDGQPKLADIGLVASVGQRSFVGTEGYVPPEGPGSPAADVYSLGKVLYEIAMGKDRLDFPELSSTLDQHPDRPRLLALNQVLLKACASNPTDRYRSAKDLFNGFDCAGTGAPSSAAHAMAHAASWNFSALRRGVRTLVHPICATSASLFRFAHFNRPTRCDGLARRPDAEEPRSL